MGTKRNYQIIVKSQEETNEHYDPNRSHNGGGYSQPLIAGIIVWKKCRKPINFVIDDQSCGEFGSRYSVHFAGPIEMSGEYYVNDVDRNREETSSIPKNAATVAIREMFEKELGYWIGLEPECEEDDYDDDDNW